MLNINALKKGVNRLDESVQMQIIRLQDMNIGFEIVSNRENELDGRWESAFTQDISKSQKRKMSFKQSMWNVFNWGKIECLKEQRAVDAFDQQKKGGCYLIYAMGEEAIYIPKADRIKAKDIIHAGSPGKGNDNADNEQPTSASSVDYLIDLYVVDEEFNWTYVLPHEEDCGPYFHKL